MALWIVTTKYLAESTILMYAYVCHNLWDMAYT